MKRNIKQALALIVVVAYSTTNVVLGALAESRFWAERRQNASSRSEKANPGPYPQLARLPSNMDRRPGMLLAGAQVLAPGKNLGPHLRQGSGGQAGLPPVASAKGGATVPLQLRVLLSSLPSSVGTVRQIQLPKKDSTGPLVVHIQDVHRNAEAQSNIGRALQELINQKQVGTVALEGAFKSIDVTPFRTFPDQAIVRNVADNLLARKEISGPIHTALVSGPSIPIFLGIDDPTHYRANVNAYRQSISLAGPCRQQLEEERQALALEKKQTYHPGLARFDEKIQAYRSGSLPFGDLALFIANESPAVSAGMKKFIEVLKLERSLDFHRVEQERTQLLTALIAALDSSQASALMQASVEYQTGRWSHEDFYGYLNAACHKKGIDLSRFPAMQSYLHYVLLSNELDVEQLLQELNRKEQEIYSLLARTETEKRLVAKDKTSYLTGKLIDFSLSKEEWTEYKKCIPRLFHLRQGYGGQAWAGARPAEAVVWRRGVGGGYKSTIPFESFYREAEARDQAMAENLLKAVQGTGPIVLVTGGFHSQGMDQKLRDAGCTVVTFVPRLTKADLNNAAAYLSVFAQEKTPLDKLFEGEKLFLAEDPLSLTAYLKGMVRTADHGFRIGAFSSEDMLAWLKSAGPHLHWFGLQLRRGVGDSDVVSGFMSALSGTTIHFELSIGPDGSIRLVRGSEAATETRGFQVEWYMLHYTPSLNIVFLTKKLMDVLGVTISLAKERGNPLPLEGVALRGCLIWQGHTLWVTVTAPLEISDTIFDFYSRMMRDAHINSHLLVTDGYETPIMDYATLRYDREIHSIRDRVEAATAPSPNASGFHLAKFLKLSDETAVRWGIVSMKIEAAFLAVAPLVLCSLGWLGMYGVTIGVALFSFFHALLQLRAHLAEQPSGTPWWKKVVQAVLFVGARTVFHFAIFSPYLGYVACLTLIPAESSLRLLSALAVVVVAVETHGRFDAWQMGLSSRVLSLFYGVRKYAIVLVFLTNPGFFTVPSVEGANVVLPDGAPVWRITGGYGHEWLKGIMAFNGWKKIEKVPGMLFNALTTWWSSRQSRSEPLLYHAGWDVVQGTNKEGKSTSIREGTEIRSLTDGRVLAVVEDEMQQTIFIESNIVDSDGRKMVFHYTHLMLSRSQGQEGGLVHLDPKFKRGTVVKKGELLGRVVHSQNIGGAVASHLHLARMWMDQDARDVVAYVIERFNKQPVGGGFKKREDVIWSVLDPLVVEGKLFEYVEPLHLFRPWDRWRLFRTVNVKRELHKVLMVQLKAAETDPVAAPSSSAVTSSPPAVAPAPGPKKSPSLTSRAKHELVSKEPAVVIETLEVGAETWQAELPEKIKRRLKDHPFDAVIVTKDNVYEALDKMNLGPKLYRYKKGDAAFADEITNSVSQGEIDYIRRISWWKEALKTLAVFGVAVTGVSIIIFFLPLLGPAASALYTWTMAHPLLTWSINVGVSGLVASIYFVFTHWDGVYQVHAQSPPDALTNLKHVRFHGFRDPARWLAFGQLFFIGLIFHLPFFIAAGFAPLIFHSVFAAVVVTSAVVLTALWMAEGHREYNWLLIFNKAQGLFWLANRFIQVRERLIRHGAPVATETDAFGNPVKSWTDLEWFWGLKSWERKELLEGAHTSGGFILDSGPLHLSFPGQEAAPGLRGFVAGWRHFNQVAPERVRWHLDREDPVKHLIDVEFPESKKWAAPFRQAVLSIWNQRHLDTSPMDVLYSYLSYLSVVDTSEPYTPFREQQLKEFIRLYGYYGFYFEKRGLERTELLRAIDFFVSQPASWPMIHRFLDNFSIHSRRAWFAMPEFERALVLWLKDLIHREPVFAVRASEEMERIYNSKQYAAAPAFALLTPLFESENQLYLWRERLLAFFSPADSNRDRPVMESALGHVCVHWREVQAMIPALKTREQQLALSLSPWETLLLLLIVGETIQHKGDGEKTLDLVLSNLASGLLKRDALMDVLTITNRSNMAETPERIVTGLKEGWLTNSLPDLSNLCVHATPRDLWKKGPWNIIGSVGALVKSERLAAADIPHLTNIAIAAKFDGEGVVDRVLALVDQNAMTRNDLPAMIAVAGNRFEDAPTLYGDMVAKGLATRADLPLFADVSFEWAQEKIRTGDLAEQSFIVRYLVYSAPRRVALFSESTWRFIFQACQRGFLREAQVRMMLGIYLAAWNKGGVKTQDKVTRLDMALARIAARPWSNDSFDEVFSQVGSAFSIFKSLSVRSLYWGTQQAALMLVVYALAKEGDPKELERLMNQKVVPILRLIEYVEKEQPTMGGEFYLTAESAEGITRLEGAKMVSNNYMSIAWDSSTGHVRPSKTVLTESGAAQTDIRSNPSSPSITLLNHHLYQDEAIGLMRSPDRVVHLVSLVPSLGLVAIPLTLAPFLAGHEEIVLLDNGDRIRLINPPIRVQRFGTDRSTLSFPGGYEGESANSRPGITEYDRQSSLVFECMAFQFPGLPLLRMYPKALYWIKTLGQAGRAQLQERSVTLLGQVFVRFMLELEKFYFDLLVQRGKWERSVARDFVSKAMHPTTKQLQSNEGPNGFMEETAETLYEAMFGVSKDNPEQYLSAANVEGGRPWRMRLSGILDKHAAEAARLLPGAESNDLIARFSDVVKAQDIFKYLTDLYDQILTAATHPNTNEDERVKNISWLGIGGGPLAEFELKELLKQPLSSRIKTAVEEALSRFPKTPLAPGASGLWLTVENLFRVGLGHEKLEGLTPEEAQSRFFWYAMLELTVSLLLRYFTSPQVAFWSTLVWLSAIHVAGGVFSWNQALKKYEVVGLWNLRGPPQLQRFVIGLASALFIALGTTLPALHLLQHNNFILATLLLALHPVGNVAVAGVDWRVRFINRKIGKPVYLGAGNFYAGSGDVFFVDESLADDAENFEGLPQHLSLDRPTVLVSETEEIAQKLKPIIRESGRRNVEIVDGSLGGIVTNNHWNVPALERFARTHPRVCPELKRLVDLEQPVNVIRSKNGPRLRIDPRDTHSIFNQERTLYLLIDRTLRLLKAESVRQLFDRIRISMKAEKTAA